MLRDQRPRRYPLLRRFLAVSIAGVIFSLSVAWASALFLPFPSTAEQNRGVGISSFEWWSTSRKGTLGGVRYHSVVMPRALEYEERDGLQTPPSWAELPAPEATNSLRNDYYEIADARGWPFPCLASRFSADSAPKARQVTGSVSGGISIGQFDKSVWYDPRVLPLTPIWAGLIADVAIYSMLCALLWLGGRQCRRAWRARRHRCLQCGYDLSGTAHGKCPECGEPLRSRWVRLLKSVLAMVRPDLQTVSVVSGGTPAYSDFIEAPRASLM